MLVAYFKTLYDYNYWANAKILETAEQVSEAQFIEETPESHGRLRGTLVHVLSAEWMWRSRWQGTSPMEDLRAAVILSRLGYSPGDLDVLIFLLG